jgi:1,2-diacylglycerol 3-beta-galactosyltransferase
MNKRILFIISDTGGGHRSAANAITAALTATGVNVTCEMVDLLRASGLPGIRNAPELYAFFSSGHIWLHNFLFRLFNSAWVMDISSKLSYCFARSRIRKLVEAFKPELVVVIHPLAVRPMCTYRDETNASWPVITVVTDLISVHASWLSPRADLYLLPTQAAVDLAVKHGISHSKAVLTGFPVHPRFCAPQAACAKLRSCLGIPVDRFTLLLTSGGAGGGQVELLVKELERECSQCTLLVVTGRNSSLRQKLAERPAAPKYTYVYGFVDHMEQLMAACDVVITKAGPGTIMEAATLKNPLLVTGAVGLQEEGNIDFVLESKIGVLCSTPSTVAQEVMRLMNNATASPAPANYPCAGTEKIAQLILTI